MQEENKQKLGEHKKNRTGSMLQIQLQQQLEQIAEKMKKILKKLKS